MKYKRREAKDGNGLDWVAWILAQTQGLESTPPGESRE